MQSLRYLALATLLISAPAHAEWKEIVRSEIIKGGQWTAWIGTSPSECWMVHRTQDRAVSLKWTNGTHYWLIEKNGWKIPHGTEVPMVVQFDNNKPHTGSLQGSKVAHRINGTLHTGYIEKMLAEFFDASTMVIKFPNGSDRGWSISLDGSEKIARAYVRCVATYEKNEKAAPQPHQGGSKKSDGEDL